MPRFSKLFGKKDDMKAAFKKVASVKSVKDKSATLDADGIRRVKHFTH